MRWYFGYPVLAAGLFFGAQTLFPGERHDDPLGPPDASPAEALVDEGPKVVSAADVLATPRSRLAAFSPGARLLKTDQPAPKPSMFDYLAQAFAASASPQSGGTEHASFKAVAPASWKSAVVRVSVDAEADTPKPAGDAQKALLARDVQRELQRVGCYVGDIDGIWGPGSQRAVTEFMERVNAVLPVDEPDVFMLSLLAAETHTVCGTQCPHGQVLSAGERCLPTTLLAHNDALEPVLTQEPRRATRAPRGGSDPAHEGTTRDGNGEWGAVVAEAGTGTRGADPFHGRMSIGGPKLEAQRFHRTASLGPSLAADTLDAVPDEAVRPVAVTVEPPAAPESRPARRQARAPAAARPRPAKSSRDRNKWRSNYRHVQRLFEHPLGRM